MGISPIAAATDPPSPRAPPAPARRRRAVLLAALAPLLLVTLPVALGQEPGTATTPPGGDHAALYERVASLEEAARAGAGGWLTAPYLILTAVAGTEIAYLTALLLLRGRERPALSWSALDDGLVFALRDMPDGSKRLAVRITNVGQDAAVDIVAQADTMIPDHIGARPHLDPTADKDPRPMGSLHHGASTQVLIALSETEHVRVADGESLAFSVLLRYKAMNNRPYAYRLSGTYSKDLRALTGAVSKSLPA